MKKSYILKNNKEQIKFLYVLWAGGKLDKKDITINLNAYYKEEKKTRPFVSL